MKVLELFENIESTSVDKFQEIVKRFIKNILKDSINASKNAEPQIGWNYEDFGFLGKIVHRGGSIKTEKFNKFAISVKFLINTETSGLSKIVRSDIEKVLKLFDKVAKSNKWEIANYTFMDSLIPNVFQIVLIPENDPTSRVIDVPNFLYHLTTSDKVKSILKRGIFTNSLNIDAPIYNTGFGEFSAKFKNKLFVFNKFNEDAFYNAFDNLFKTGEMAIIKIDTSKLPKSIKFFKDVTVFDEDDDDFEGYWTKSTIPAEALELVN
jgi:hypothetical protein